VTTPEGVAAAAPWALASALAKLVDWPVAPAVEMGAPPVAELPAAAAAGSSTFVSRAMIWSMRPIAAEKLIYRGNRPQAACS
jgi:hypothetical protein